MKVLRNRQTGAMDATGVMDAVSRCDALMDDLESLLGDRFAVRNDPWSAFAWPVVRHETYAIIPLATLSPGGPASAASPLGELAEALRRRWGFRFGGHDFRVGRFQDNDEWGKRALGERLDGVGARNPFWWQAGDRAVVFVSLPGRDGSVSALGLLVIPAGWIRIGNPVPPKAKRELSRARTVERLAGAVDPLWDVADVADRPGELWVTRPIDD